MNKKPLIILSLLLSILFVSCKQAGKTGLLVPKDAGFVLHINSKSLSSKLPWEEIRQSEWFQEVGKMEKDSLAQKLMNDPASSGVKLDEDMVLFMAKHNNHGYISFIGGISDAAAFEKTLQNGSKGELQMDLKGDIKFAYEGAGSGMIGWNDKHFIVLSDMPYDGPSRGGWGEDNGARLQGDTLKQLAKKIMSLSGDELLDSDKRFASLIAETGDMHIWTSASAFAGETLGMVSSMMKIGALLEGNIGVATLNFDNGKITLDGRQYFGDQMTDLVKKHSPSELTNDQLAHLPAGQVIAAGAFNFPPDGIPALAKLIGMDGMANGFLGEYNFSLEEFAKANKGNILFAVSDFGVANKTISYEGVGGKMESMTVETPEVSFVAGVAVGDKESFGKMVAIAQKQMPDADNAQMATPYELTDQWFVVGNKPEAVSGFLAGKTAPSYASTFSGHQGGFYFDINRLLTRIKEVSAQKSENMGEMESKALESSLATWQDVVMYSDIKGGESTFHFEINMVDKTTNSLKQLNKYLGGLAKTAMDQQKKIEMEYMPVDTTAVPPAVEK